jgi:hypothetical protein
VYAKQGKKDGASRDRQQQVYAEWGKLIGRGVSFPGSSRPDSIKDQHALKSAKEKKNI